MATIYNFGAGPAMLPPSILKEAQAELLDWQGLGLSVMELGHRTPACLALMEELELRFRQLLAIPAHYKVLFLAGAARSQFSMVPMNLLQGKGLGAYIVSGLWSSMAYTEAARLRSAYCLASSEEQGFKCVPHIIPEQIQNDTRYIYYTPNETVHGIRFTQAPSHNDLPLVADMTSCLLSEPLNMSDFALVFAGAQKNISIPGLTLLVIRDDLLALETAADLPCMLDYRIHAEHKSLYATPPMFNCYLALKMMTWIEEQGGVSSLYDRNCQKAAALYECIDSSSFYYNDLEPSDRSIVNVCFQLSRPEVLPEFITGAEERGLYALKGHRHVGGLRASLYNAMPLAGVEALTAYMRDFAKEHE